MCAPVFCRFYLGFVLFLSAVLFNPYFGAIFAILHQVPVFLAIVFHTIVVYN